MSRIRLHPRLLWAAREPCDGLADGLNQGTGVRLGQKEHLGGEDLGDSPDARAHHQEAAGGSLAGKVKREKRERLVQEDLREEKPKGHTKDRQSRGEERSP